MSRFFKILLFVLLPTFFAPAVGTVQAQAQLLINPYQYNAFTAEYQAVLDRATTLGYTKPSAAQQVKQNQLVVDLKAAGIWTQLDVLYVFATDGDSDFATLNWKSPTTFQASKTNSPTFTTNQGFTGNGSSSFINTNFNPATDAVNYTLNDAGRFSYVFAAGDIIDGIFSSGRNRLRALNTDQQRINQDNGLLNASADMTGSGYKSINRTSSTNVELFNGSTQISRTATSTSIVNATQIVLASFTSFGTSTVSFYALGGALNTTENGNFKTAFDTYIGSL